jgi:hypothetical protein
MVPAAIFAQEARVGQAPPVEPWAGRDSSGAMPKVRFTAGRGESMACHLSWERAPPAGGLSARPARMKYRACCHIGLDTHCRTGD